MRRIICFLMPSLAYGSFFEEHARGWHWYEKKPEKIQKKDPPKEVTTALSATAVLGIYKKELERRLHVALLEPTPENLKAYMTMQKDMMDKSDRFSTMWQKVVFTTPDLDETVKRPVSQYGNHVYKQEKDKAKDTLIKDLSKTHGLFFFFKGNCPYCHAFAPIVKRFADSYGWKVMAISLDGSTLEDFPDATPDNGIAGNLKITSVPALLAVEPSSHTVIPLSYGAISEEDIKERLLILKGQQPS